MNTELTKNAKNDNATFWKTIKNGRKYRDI